MHVAQVQRLEACKVFLGFCGFTHQKSLNNTKWQFVSGYFLGENLWMKMKPPNISLYIYHPYTCIYVDLSLMGVSYQLICREMLANTPQASLFPTPFAKLYHQKVMLEGLQNDGFV